ncbi:isochorismatase family protein [Mycolicibacter senuensis]|uniref:isochorismatase family protein n=1 Tax=Mycolicibacter senuensis TaxID=386913 RepID=UPI002570DE96|nr:isochorismatase family protein [Mycolicibacter senuensis]
MTSTPQWAAPEPRHAAVVCIECQNGVLGKDSILPALAADAQPALAAIGQLLAIARSAGALVVHTPFAGSLGGSPGTAPLMRATARATADWAPGHPATEILATLLDPADLVVPRHQGVSPTWGTELLPLLRAKDIHTLIFAGVSLNVAIPLAVGQAVHEGFHAVVPRDAVVGTPVEYGQLVLKNTIAMLARITDVAELAAAWHTSEHQQSTTTTDSVQPPRKVDQR